MSGLFITFEGVEGSGKTTQIALLAHYLRECGREVALTREPGGTPLAERIRDLLLDVTDEPVSPLSELLLYEAARAQHVAGIVRPALDAGTIVLCDRYVDSTTAYQGAGRRIDRKTIETLNRFAATDAWPNRTFILDVPAETGLLRARVRGSNDRMMTETLDFHTRIRNEFLLLAQREPERITIIDGTRTQDAVHAELRKHVDALLT